MKRKKVIIIGAGIAGLCAGSYLQMNDYDTEIFELHSIAGGMCTGWRRKGYTFEGCIHWLVGSSPANSLYKLWCELGAVQGKEMIDFDEYTRVEYGDNKLFSLYTDVDRLEKELFEIAPEDEKHIRDFTNAVRKAGRVEMPVDKARELYTFGDTFKMLFKSFPFIKLMGKWGKMTVGEFAGKLKNPVLRENFTTFLGLDNNFSMAVAVMMLSWMNVKSAGYPVGGSLGFIKTIEDNYIKLGGKINFNSRVSKILVEDNKACGIKLENGKTYVADIVISAADGHLTIFDMLDGKYVNKEITDMYNTGDLFTPLIQVSIGAAREFKNSPHYINMKADSPITVDNKYSIDRIPIRIFNFDPTMAPSGKTAIAAMLPADYEYWTQLKKRDIERYNAEKDRIAKEVIDMLDRKLGDVASKVEVYDVATPSTYERYTNVWRSSWEGWCPTPRMMMKRIKNTLPDLKNFYMAGQWVRPGGGLPGGLMSGRDVTQVICKNDNKEFKLL